MPLEGEGRIRGWKTGRVGGHEGRAYQIDTRRKVRAGEGHEGGLSVSTVGPSRDPDRRLRLRTHSLSTGWNTRINGGATMEREREIERMFVSIHVNYRTRGGERQREEGAPFFFSFPQLPLYF